MWGVADYLHGLVRGCNVTHGTPGFNGLAELGPWGVSFIEPRGTLMGDELFIAVSRESDFSGEGGVQRKEGERGTSKGGVGQVLDRRRSRWVTKNIIMELS